MGDTRYVFSTQDTRRYRFPTHVNDLVMDRAEAQRSEAFIVVLEPGEAPPVHRHDDCEQIFFVTAGHGQLQIGQDAPQYFPVRAGDLVRIPADAWHAIRCEGNQNLVYLSIDCFLNGPPAAEPTWDSHVRGICRKYGWDFDQVIGRGA
jgi:mannose-6-phosphate isomerase-like protein (cupin superfamily)